VAEGKRRLVVTEQLYDDIADWWPVISPPSEYAEEAALYVEMIRSAARRPVREVLELGSGGGNNASHMKQAFAMTLIEPAEGMRELSRALNPECTHLPGDMRTVRLGRTFDAVFVHDAVMYMTTEDDLRAALQTVAIHLAPGGVALVAPDATAETFAEATEHGGGEDESGRRARYLQWTVPPSPGETSFETHYAFLLREPDGIVRAAHDVHREGLFPRATWLRLFGEVGLAASLAPRKIEGGEYDLFIAFHDAPKTCGTKTVSRARELGLF
jgi:SAM-dependent methyltransferase